MASVNCVATVVFVDVAVTVWDESARAVIAEIGAQTTVFLVL